MDPFTVNEETKSMVLDNICHMLNNFLRCDALENIVFCWVMHEPSISDGILARLNLAEAECRVHKISLTCREDVLCARLRSDIERGLRTPDVIPRSVARLPLYQSLDTFLFDVSDIAPEEAARQIVEKF
ncbi:MAG: nucleotide kinase [Eubacteriales bacterium]